MDVIASTTASQDFFPVVMSSSRAKRLSSASVAPLRLADAEHELDRADAELYTAIVLADAQVRKMLQQIRQRIVIALGAVRTQRGEDRE